MSIRFYQVGIAFHLEAYQVAYHIELPALDDDFTITHHEWFLACGERHVGKDVAFSVYRVMQACVLWVEVYIEAI